jgi:hypothetical protein
MARPLRITFPGTCYHVTAPGNARQRIRRDDRDRETFLGRRAAALRATERTFRRLIDSASTALQS